MHSIISKGSRRVSTIKDLLSKLACNREARAAIKGVEISWKIFVFSAWTDAMMRVKNSVNVFVAFISRS